MIVQNPLITFGKPTWPITLNGARSSLGNFQRGIYNDPALSRFLDPLPRRVEVLYPELVLSSRFLGGYLKNHQNPGNVYDNIHIDDDDHHNIPITIGFISLSWNSQEVPRAEILLRQAEG